MNLGWVAESPNTSRSRAIAVLMLLSKSTKVSSGQSFCWNSSRATNSPGRSSRMART